MTTLRQARVEDAPEIAALWNEVISDSLITFTTQTTSAEETEELIAARGPAFWVCEDRQGVVGFATYGPFRSGPGYAHTAEHSIYVADFAQGQGVGRDLLRALEVQAKGAGLHVLIAAISGANPGAQRFHQKLGYAEHGRLPQLGRKAGQWLDLVLMQKILHP